MSTPPMCQRDGASRPFAQIVTRSGARKCHSRTLHAAARHGSSASPETSFTRDLAYRYTRLGAIGPRHRRTAHLSQLRRRQHDRIPPVGALR